MRQHLTIRDGVAAGTGARRTRVADVGTVGLLLFVSIAALLSRHFMYI